MAEIVYGSEPIKVGVLPTRPPIIHAGEQRLGDEVSALKAVRLEAANKALRKALTEALAQIEHTSRYAYDPLGTLSQRDFEAAWFQADADTYTQWARLRAQSEAA